MLDFNSSPYFQSLPPFVQESIMQSGLSFKNEEDLRKFAENFNKAED